VKDAWDEEADFVVVGSGAAGATAALDLTRAGADVLVLEEGGWFTRPDFRPDLYSSLSRLWRDFGGQVATGRAAFPIAQGRCVGGSTVINAATMHRLPRAIWEEWATDPAIREGLPWSALEEAAASLERDLGIARNIEPMLGELAMTRTLERLGWEYQAQARAAPGCRHTNRCLQGCPSGGKLSLERAMIPEAVERGARIRPHRRAERIVCEGGVATGVEVGHRDGPGPFSRTRRSRIRARRAVLLAAGVVHSPLVLRRSGLRNPHIGRHFQCHVGGSVVAEFATPVAAIEGPSLGYEIFQFPGLKLNSVQPTPPEILLGNVPVVGRELVALLRRIDHVAVWNSSIRCGVEGRVRGRWLGLPQIALTPGSDDLERIRTSAYHLAHLLFEAGASRVYPGIQGIPRTLTDPASIEAIHGAPLDPRSYALNVSHLFGTCRMAGDASRGVVAPDFRTHEVDRLFVIDASVFPTNVGTNPQLAVQTLAREAARRVLACS
jgi:choline dehydrogenase-like flavoprotein